MPANQSCSYSHRDAMIVKAISDSVHGTKSNMYTYIFREPTRVSWLIHLSLNVNISSFYLAHL